MMPDLYTDITVSLQEPARHIGLSSLDQTMVMTCTTSVSRKLNQVICLRRRFPHFWPALVLKNACPDEAFLKKTVNIHKHVQYETTSSVYPQQVQTEEEGMMAQKCSELLFSSAQTQHEKKEKQHLTWL